MLVEGFTRYPKNSVSMRLVREVISYPPNDYHKDYASHTFSKFPSRRPQF